MQTIVAIFLIRFDSERVNADSFGKSLKIKSNPLTASNSTGRRLWHSFDYRTERRWMAQQSGSNLSTIYEMTELPINRWWSGNQSVCWERNARSNFSNQSPFAHSRERARSFKARNNTSINEAQYYSSSIQCRLVGRDSSSMINLECVSAANNSLLYSAPRVHRVALMTG